MLYLLVVSFIWAFSFGIIGSTLVRIPSMDVAFLRLAIATLVFLPWVRRVPVQLGVRLALLGIVQFALMYFFYHAAFPLLRSHEVALYTITTPIFVILISDIASRTFHARYWVISLVAVLGSALIKWHWPESFSVLGFALVQLSNLCFAVGQLYYRHLMKNVSHRDAHVFFWPYLGATLFLFLMLFLRHALFYPLPLSMFFTKFYVLFTILITPKQWLALGYLGIIASGLSFFLWNIGSRKVSSAGILAVMNNLKIPLAVTVSLLFFKESASLPSLVAGSLLFLAALLMGCFRCGGCGCRRVHDKLHSQ